MIFDFPKPHCKFDYPKGKIIWMIKWDRQLYCRAGISNLFSHKNYPHPDIIIYHSLSEAISECWRIYNLKARLSKWKDKLK